MTKLLAIKTAPKSRAVSLPTVTGLNCLPPGDDGCVEYFGTVFTKMEPVVSKVLTKEEQTRYGHGSLAKSNGRSQTLKRQIAEGTFTVPFSCSIMPLEQSSMTACVGAGLLFVQRLTLHTLSPNLRQTRRDGYLKIQKGTDMPQDISQYSLAQITLSLNEKPLDDRISIDDLRKALLQAIRSANYGCDFKVVDERRKRQAAINASRRVGEC
jgi:hypothetical protein